MGDLSAVDLADKHPVVLVYAADLCLDAAVEFSVDADVRTRPVRLLNVLQSVLVVVIAVHLQLLPQLQDAGDVGLVGTVEAVLVLDLEQDDGSSFGGQEGTQHRHQRFEVLLRLSKVRMFLALSFIAFILGRRRGWPRKSHSART